MDEEPKERIDEDIIADRAAERLLWLRKRMGLTQPFMAEIAGVGVPSYAKYEQGSRGIKAVERATWIRLAEAGGVAAAWLAGFDVPMVNTDAIIPLYDMVTGEESTISADTSIRATLAIRLNDTMDLRWPEGWIAWVTPVDIRKLHDGAWMAVQVHDGRIVVGRLHLHGKTGRSLWPESRETARTGPVRATDDKYCPVILALGPKTVAYRIVRVSHEL